MRFKERVALITGAGSGIGRALAMGLARRGCHLALADVNSTGLGESIAAVQGLGVRVSGHRIDVANREAVATLPADVLAAGHMGIDLLINNAGVALGGNFDQVSEADFDWLMDINFNGMVRMTRAFLPMLQAAAEARIVNLSSVYGLIAPPGQCAYSASKFAVRGFSNALRHELLGSTVGVTVVHPGGIATAIARNARVPAGVTGEQIRRQQARFEKMLRMPPERAAEIILDAVQRNRARVLVGADATLVAWLERLAPVRYWGLLARLLNAQAS